MSDDDVLARLRRLELETGIAPSHYEAAGDAPSVGPADAGQHRFEPDAERDRSEVGV